jgi:hypothetical protein
MNDSTYEPTLCVGADVHLDEIVLRAVNKALGHEVLERFRVTKVDNLYSRYYFILHANLLRRYNLEYKAYYWRKYQEASRYQHNRALVLTARKLVRLVHALLTRNESCVRPRMANHDQEDHGLQ